MTVDETAESLGLSRHVVAEDWRTTKKWLQGVLKD